MSKKSFSVYVVFAVIASIMIIMNFSVLIFSPILFGINMCITLIILSATFVLLKNYKDYIFGFSQTVKSFMEEKKLEILEAVPLAFAMSSEKRPDKIILYNSIFKEKFLNGEDCFDISIEDFLPSQTFGKDITEGEISVNYRNKKFKVYAKKIEDFTVFYFLDDTDYLVLQQKYFESRPCIAYAIFDNKEALRQEISEEQTLQLTILVESALKRWIDTVKGIVKKLSGGKYLIIFEQRYLKEFMNEKFKIIDKIHEIKIDSHKFATVSLGISRGAKNFQEAKAWAGSALSMALGRGGDQVVVKNNDNYDFFGGASQGLEKRSKVRTRVVASALMEKIDSCDRVFIMGHKFSDFDSVGSSIGLWSVCSRQKKKPSYIVVNSKSSLANTAISSVIKAGFADAVISPQEAGELITDKSFLIIVDTHCENFVEDFDIYKKFKHVAVIDHHRMTVNKISGADILFHEPFASSTCEMVTELVQYMGDKSLKKWEAECLLAGIMLDTKNFSLKSGVRTFEAAAYLKKKGADSAEVKKMFADSIETYKVKCKIIENAYIFENCAIAKYEEKNENARLSCAQAADELLNIKNISASFVIFNNGDSVGISARSLGEINVQVIMENLGGGGHQTMAAATLKEISIEEAEEKLMKILKMSISVKNIKNGE